MTIEKVGKGISPLLTEEQVNKDGSNYEVHGMAKKERIVIVTDKFDPHADMVIVELRQMGYQPVRLHPADFPVSASATLEFDQHHWSGELSHSKGPIDLDAIKSIWWRRPEPHVIAADLPQKERDFALRETGHAFAGLWSILDCYWMSVPFLIRLASNKIEQLQRAAQLGFRVPHTLVTNDPSQVQTFYERCGGNMVYKALASPPRPAICHLMMTRLATRTRPDAPGYAQET